MLPENISTIFFSNKVEIDYRQWLSVMLFLNYHILLNTHFQPSRRKKWTILKVRTQGSHVLFKIYFLVHSSTFTFYFHFTLIEIFFLSLKTLNWLNFSAFDYLSPNIATYTDYMNVYKSLPWLFKNLFFCYQHSDFGRF